jgi:glycosyltransferase involved in cell wall biosynthesis
MVISSLTEEEIANISPSTIDFYIKLAKRLRLIGCLKSAKLAFLKALEKTKDKPNILFMTANMGGGLGRYSNELTSIMRDNYNVFLLIIDDGKNLILKYGNLEIQKWDLGSPVLFENMFGPNMIDQILDFVIPDLRIRAVHLNGFLGIGFNVIETIKKYSVPIVYTAHDFHLICISQHLINNKGEYCNLCQYGKEAKGCLGGNFYSDMFGKINAAKLNSYRKYIKNNVLPAIDCFVYPSEYSKNTLQNFYQEIKQKKSVVIPHGIPDLVQRQKRITEGKRVNIGIIGDIGVHKGLKTIKQLTEELPRRRFHFTLFGSLDGDTELANTYDTGRYSYEEIVGKLEKSSVDVMLVLSECPESFSYTISECIAAGIPIITNNIGAQAERVKKSKAGWIVPSKNILEKIEKKLNEIYENRSLLERKSINIIPISI